MPAMKYWEITADKLTAAGLELGLLQRRYPRWLRWIVDAHTGDGKRYIVESDELLSAFLELEAIAL
jgi:hypothetical protein